MGATVSALRFRFGVTLDRPDLSRKLVLAHRPRKLPDVLSVDEVARLLEAAPGIKYRAALDVAYGADLRVSEVAHLKADAIDSKRMLIRIEEGKGRKDRNAMLSPQLLELLAQIHRRRRSPRPGRWPAPIDANRDREAVVMRLLTPDIRSCPFGASKSSRGMRRSETKSLFHVQAVKGRSRRDPTSIKLL